MDFDYIYLYVIYTYRYIGGNLIMASSLREFFMIFLFIYTHLACIMTAIILQTCILDKFIELRYLYLQDDIY